MEYYPNRKTNYGPLTEVSKSLNSVLGDSSGRTVSFRTAQGFINLFKVSQIEEEAAEHIVHLGMATAATLLKSKDEGLKATGALLSFTLFLCYHAGK